MAFSRPRISTIPIGAAFIESIANGLIDDFSKDKPNFLSDVIILLPDRWAAGSLTQAFVDLVPRQAILLPRIYAISDFGDPLLPQGRESTALDLIKDRDSIPATISITKRKILLARLVHRWWTTRTERVSGTFDQALHVATSLANFLDQFQTARLNFSALDTLVPEDLAAHWHETVDFLRIITEQWPRLLAEQHLIDPAQRRNMLLKSLKKQWEQSAPTAPVILVGTAGSIPATMDLLETVSKLPTGHIVLPGLDQELDEASWQQLEESHPQYWLKCLLDRLSIARSKVLMWSNTTEPTFIGERRKLLSNFMCPEIFKGRPRETKIALAAVHGLQSITCPDLTTEARVVAMLMRKTLENPGHTAALVTTDRELVDRVKVELRRWQLKANDSVGVPLPYTTTGIFLRLIATMASSDALPIPLLSMLKHPLCSAGIDGRLFRRYVNELELDVFRGTELEPGFQSILDVLHMDPVKRELVTWFESIASAAETLLALTRSEPQELNKILHAHLRFAEWLSSNPSDGIHTNLWDTDEGKAVNTYLQELIAYAEEAPAVFGHEYANIFAGLLSDKYMDVPPDEPPRLYIWSPLEARLQNASLIIFGGLNEDIWPRHLAEDSWLSPTMRKSLGMPTSEQLTGFSAHNFGHLFCARNIVLTRSEKKDGSETIPSRWLIRLAAVLQTNRELPSIVDQSSYWTALAELLDKPNSPKEKLAPPSPCPPVSARPRRMSVTHVEQWMRNPYDIFARNILKLYPLKPINSSRHAGEYGIIIHKTLSRFVHLYPCKLPDNAHEQLIEIAKEFFASRLSNPHVKLFWWPRFKRIASWFIELEKNRRSDLIQSFAECEGQLEIHVPGGKFILTTRADRIDQRMDGTFDIVDYKTGVLPSKVDVVSGRALQLPLEAAIGNKGGFVGLAEISAHALVHVRLNGGDPAGMLRSISEDVPAVAKHQLSTITQLITLFDNKTTPYRAVASTDPNLPPSQYQHLSRVREWSLSGDNE